MDTINYQYLPVKARSVPPFLVIRYCSSVSAPCHSSSDFLCCFPTAENVALTRAPDRPLHYGGSTEPENRRRAIRWFLVGGGFLVFYFYRRDFGLLIPGCIILSLGLGTVGNSVFPDLTQGLALGIGFVAITVVALIYEKRFVWWPLIPGGFMLFIALFDDTDVAEWFFRRGWPLAIVGALLLIRSLRRERRVRCPRLC